MHLDRAFGTDARTGPAIDALHADDGFALLDPDRFGGAYVRTCRATGASLCRDLVMHITTVWDYKSCPHPCQYFSPPEWTRMRQNRPVPPFPGLKHCFTWNSPQPGRRSKEKKIPGMVRRENIVSLRELWHNLPDERNHPPLRQRRMEQEAPSGRRNPLVASGPSLHL